MANPRVTTETRRIAKKLAYESYAGNDPTGWFERLYSGAAGDIGAIPWADMTANSHLVEWAGREKLDGRGKRALVVGCGLGDDAIFLASLGFSVTAFDVAASAVDWAKGRFPQSAVRFVVADLLNLPADFGVFDFVFEAYTIQAMPHSVRERAVGALPAVVAPGGRLLLVCRGRHEDEDRGELPFPLLKSELAPLLSGGLVEQSFEDYFEQGEEPVRRFRAVYFRPA